MKLVELLLLLMVNLSLLGVLIIVIYLYGKIILQKYQFVFIYFKTLIKETFNK